MSMRQKKPKGRLTVTVDGEPFGWHRVMAEHPHNPAWRLAKLRDGLRVVVPMTITFEPEDPSAGPTIVMDVDEITGSLVTTRVELIGNGHPIDTSTVRGYSLPKLMAVGAMQAAAPARGWDAFDEGEPWPPTNRRLMDSIEAATRSRVAVDADRLEEVAELYRDGGVRAVAGGLHRSRSQAYRLIRSARDAGHLGEEE